MNKKQMVFYLLALLVLFIFFYSIISFASENDSDIETLVKGNNTFALELYSKLKDEENGNLFFSPYSISTALAMTYAGARDETAIQMANVLHFDLTQKLLHPTFSEIIQDLEATPEARGYQLNIANALWGQKDYGFLKEFLSLIELSYGGGFYEVDFVHAREEARQIINQWVEEKTQDKIKDLILPPDLNSLTRLVLTNAIYFKGNWVARFKKENTKDTPFKLITGEEVNVPMMNQTENFNYAEDDMVQILEMPYVGKELSMVIFLPKQAEGLKQLEERFTIDNFKRWLSRLRPQKVIISIPKFKTTSRFYLGEILSEMGMTDAFSLPPADFSGMTGRKDLFISKVIHKAFVDVNEEGTEAAAATAVVMRLGISIPKEFRADHPFLFLIRDNRSNSILFLGRVMSPKR